MRLEGGKSVGERECVQWPIPSRTQDRDRCASLLSRTSRMSARKPLFCRWAAWDMAPALNESLWLALPASQRPRLDKACPCPKLPRMRGRQEPMVFRSG